MTIELRVDDYEVLAALNQLIRAADDLTPAMREAAGVLADAAERAFDEQRDPTTGRGWHPLAESTIERRAAGGHWPGSILQVSGQLAASIQSEYDARNARAGSNKIYAAIHQFGGQAGPGHRVTIPARPFLGVGEPERAELLAIFQRYFSVE